MDVDEIEFSDWQIEKMRSALRRYRTIRKQGGRMPSWSQVRDDITNSESNLEKYAADDAELAFKVEALRRFAENLSTALSKDRMQDLARFLSDEKLFDPEFYQEDKRDLANLLAMQDFLSSDHDNFGNYFDAFNGTLKYTFPFLPYHKVMTTITLNFNPDASRKFVRIEEVVQSTDLEQKKLNENDVDRKRFKKSEFTRTASRKGYGFPVTKLNMMHAFLDGVVPGDQITYVQAFELHENFAENGVFLIRNGVATNKDCLPKDEYYKEPVVLSNIYRFTPERPDMLSQPEPDVSCAGGRFERMAFNPLKKYQGHDKKTLRRLVQKEFILKIKEGEAHTAMKYLQLGIDINAQDEFGMTALHYAAAYGLRPCIRALIKTGKCDFLVKDNKGRLASDLAYEWGRDYAVGLLLQKREARQAYQENQG